MAEDGNIRFKTCKILNNCNIYKWNRIMWHDHLGFVVKCDYLVEYGWICHFLWFTILSWYATFQLDLGWCSKDQRKNTSVTHMDHLSVVHICLHVNWLESKYFLFWNHSHLMASIGSHGVKKYSVNSCLVLLMLCTEMEKDIFFKFSQFWQICMIPTT